MKKTVLVMLCICSLALLQNCGSSKKASKSTVTAVSFDKDVLPIMQARCTPCHFPPDGRKKPLNTYDAVKDNINDIVTRIQLPQSNDKFMPWKSKKPALSDSMINVLMEWQRQNMPK